MPVEKRTAQASRRVLPAAPRRPFHLRLPDVSVAESPRATRGPEPRPKQQAVAIDPTARARSQLTHPQLPTTPAKSGPSQSARSTGIQSAVPNLSQKRYQEGHQQVTDMIERMREKRRKLFDRLWVASIVVTALSVVALAVELIQGIQSPVPTRVANPSVKKPDARRHLAQSPVAAPSRPDSAAATRASANERQDTQPVTSALYTTEDGSQPKGVWLDGPVANSDSVPERPSRGGPHDGHQSRTP